MIIFAAGLSHPFIISYNYQSFPHHHFISYSYLQQCLTHYYNFMLLMNKLLYFLTIFKKSSVYINLGSKNLLYNANIF